MKHQTTHLFSCWKYFKAGLFIEDVFAFNIAISSKTQVDFVRPAGWLVLQALQHQSEIYLACEIETIFKPRLCKEKLKIHSHMWYNGVQRYAQLVFESSSYIYIFS